MSNVNLQCLPPLTQGFLLPTYELNTLVYPFHTISPTQACPHLVMLYWANSLLLYLCVSRPKFPGFISYFCYFLAVIWASYLTTWGPSFLICKMGITVLLFISYLLRAYRMLSTVLGAEHETSSHHQEADIQVKRHRPVIEVNMVCQKVIRAVEGSKMGGCEALWFHWKTDP